jgi:extracellular elastinolytic metalloproteinase
MLVDKYGFDPNQYTGTGGNNRWLFLVTDGMKLQPCRPTMIDARDAIIESNQLNYGGADVCDLWAIFARRGLGVSATSGTRVGDGFDVPASC